MHLVTAGLCAAAACAQAQERPRYDVVAEPESLFLPPHGDEGCFVSFFAAPGYGMPSAQLRGRSFVESFETGPVVKPELKHVGGEKFFAEASSLVVGPNAVLVGYAERNFRKAVLELGPGRHVADLSAIDFHERVRSLKVFCE